MTLEEKKKKYQSLAHAIQAGVAALMEIEPKHTEPKHLRVGVNMALCEQGALITLLFQKGIITEDEYWDANIAKLEEEKANYEKVINDHYQAGGSIKLGSLY